MIKSRTYRKQPSPSTSSRSVRSDDEPTIEEEKLAEEVRTTYTLERRKETSVHPISAL